MFPLETPTDVTDIGVDVILSDDLASELTNGVGILKRVSVGDPGGARFLAVRDVDVRVQFPIFVIFCKFGSWIDIYDISRLTSVELQFNEQLPVN